MYGDQTLAPFIYTLSGRSPAAKVLDIGPGRGEQTQTMRAAGLDVVTVGPRAGDVPCLWPTDSFSTKLIEIDGIWACHVLEHSRTPGPFLEACFMALKPGGLFAVIVPPAKRYVVGGHVTLWTLGLLLYNLILAGFDCREAAVGAYGYNLSVMVRAEEADLPELNHDAGDIELVSRYFPKGVDARQGFDGTLPELV